MSGISALVRRDMRELASTVSYLECEDKMRRRLSVNQEECLHLTPYLLVP